MGKGSGLVRIQLAHLARQHPRCLFPSYNADCGTAFSQTLSLLYPLVSLPPSQMGILYELGPGVPSLLRNRQQQSNPDPGAGFSNVLLPVLVVGGVVLLVSIGLYFRRRLRREAAATTGAATTTAAATPTAQVAARRRRNRRRASQISTKSLPAYMEEAGDEEVVLVRCDMRDSRAHRFAYRGRSF